MEFNSMKKGIMFKFMRVIAVLAVATIIAVLLIVLKPKAERQVLTETGRLVEVFPARTEKVNMIIETYGTVIPREALKLVAEVRGQIVDTHFAFEEGRFFEKGTTLIKIDPRTYRLEVERRRIQINQAVAELNRLQQEVRNLEASMKIAKSDTELALAEFNRFKKLLSKNLVSQSTLDKTEQRHLSSLERLQGFENQMALTGPGKEQLEAQRDMAGVLLRQAELDLERTRIVTSFDGWVLEKAIEEGQHVNVGQYLGRVYSEGGLDIEARIPVKDLKWFPTDLTKDTMPEATIIFSSEGAAHTWKGRVARIKAQMDEKTRTLPVVVEVIKIATGGENSSLLYLRPGMFVTVQIKGIEIKQAFVLPRHVVHAGDVVYIAQDNRLRIKPVSVLRTFKDSVFVDKGLKDGELVIKTPLPEASDGMQVRMQHEIFS